MSLENEITINKLTEFDLITSNSNQEYELSKKLKKDLESIDITDKQIHSDLQDNPKEKKLYQVCKDDIDFIKKYLAVSNNIEDVSFENQIKLTFVLDTFIKPELEFGGVPDAFLPVRGKHLRTAINLYPKSIIYAWRDDCNGCDLQKEVFNKIFEKEREAIALFAVYGKNCASLLDDKFNVSGAPTTLFCLNGNVDSRLIGSQSEQSVRNEINVIQNTTL